MNLQAFDPDEHDLVTPETIPLDVQAVLNAWRRQMLEYNTRLLSTTQPWEAHKIVELKNSYNANVTAYLAGLPAALTLVVKQKEKPSGA